ncbi:OCIA domain-containing protein 1 [Megalops cyprinoides]|uniref:OCIA domain-containing protein 1 n=1 Tax=Megalops cyprinoides TaxID=118141 RepID=UPI001864C02C|nr:OCIA domain-containing protein 1 [Megalops cyprinoides]
MSQASSGFPGAPQQHGVSPQGPMGLDYIPTEEERRVFRECNQESFWYRSVPFSVAGMFLTQGLISRGVLTSSTRFGSLPKVAFAGLCGYLAGKMSYMKTCQEKFKNLENSPLGEALRQGHRNLPPQFSPQKQLDEANQTAFESNSQPSLDLQGPAHPYSDFSYSDSSYQPAPFSSALSDSAYQPAPFSSALSESAPTGAADDVSPQAPPYLEEEEKPKKRSILYEELRSKNRENYEVTLTQKAETLLKPAPDRAAPKKEVKKNIYGDTWEE